MKILLRWLRLMQQQEWQLQLHLIQKKLMLVRMMMHYQMMIFFWKMMKMKIQIMNYRKTMRM